MFNMLANGAETGTWSIDKLGDAVKEFNIRMSDGTANEYLEQLGLNTEEVIAQFNKGGPEAQAAIGDIMEALQECRRRDAAISGRRRPVWHYVGGSGG